MGKDIILRLGLPGLADVLEAIISGDLTAAL